MGRPRGIILGIGINDADYNVCIMETIGRRENGGYIQKCVWMCPFYSTWRNMVKRCYCAAAYNKDKQYKDCVVYEPWLTFSKFKAWMVTQDWEGKVLDKDLLVKGNKIYGPDTCIFISQTINIFIAERHTKRDLPVGVTLDMRYKACYLAQGRTSTNEKGKYLGRFKTPEEAHMAWLKEKLEAAKILAAEQSDKRVADALIYRYENYTEISREYANQI